MTKTIIITTALVLLALSPAAFGQQDLMMKRQAPSMRPVPSMKPLAMTKTKPAAGVRKKIKKKPRRAAKRVRKGK
jgi:hypothetical protein